MVFRLKDVPEIGGKVAVVTGGNTGLGLATAIELARKGAHVILACRSKEKSEVAVDKIKKETGNELVDFMELDLSSMDSILSFCEEYKRRQLSLNILINNAGVMMNPFTTTKEGLESQIGVNHFGHALLTLLLIEVLEKSQPSRVVMISSAAHQYSYSNGVQFEHLHDKRYYAPERAYGQSKLCNILFACSLADRLKDKKIYVNCVHPGYVITELQRNVSVTWGWFGGAIGAVGYKFFAKSPQKGSLTGLYVATSAEIEANDERGQYFIPDGVKGRTSRLARDKTFQEKLWNHTIHTFQEKLGDRFIDPFGSIRFPLE